MGDSDWMMNCNDWFAVKWNALTCHGMR